MTESKVPGGIRTHSGERKVKHYQIRRNVNVIYRHASDMFGLVLIVRMITKLKLSVATSVYMKQIYDDSSLKN